MMIVFGFVNAETSEQARHTLRTIADTAIATEPGLRNWRVI